MISLRQVQWTYRFSLVFWSFIANRASESCISTVVNITKTQKTWCLERFRIKQLFACINIMSTGHIAAATEQSILNEHSALHSLLRCLSNQFVRRQIASCSKTQTRRKKRVVRSKHRKETLRACGYHDHRAGPACYKVGTYIETRLFEIPSWTSSPTRVYEKKLRIV